MRKIFILCLFICIYQLNAKEVRFRNANMLMNWGMTWMFDYYLDDPFVYHNTVPHILIFEDLCYARMNYSYSTYQSTTSQSELLSYSDFAPLSGVTVPDTSYNLVLGDRYSDTKFIVCGFQHINTVNPNLTWNTFNQAGDVRLYTGAVIDIEKNISSNHNVYNPVLKLRLNNACFYSISAYPPIMGTGAGIIGYGWGTIDPTVGDPNWRQEFSNSTGQVFYTFSSGSSVVQTYFGLYTSDVILSVPEYKRDVTYALNVQVPYQIDASASMGVILNIQSGYYYISSGSQQPTNMFINKMHTAPTGSYPTGITGVYQDAYWEVGNIYDVSTATVIFDMTGIPGINNPNNLRILRRTNGYGSIWVDANASIVSNNPLLLQVSGEQIMGQYCIASTGGNNLAVNAPQNVSITRSTSINGNVIIAWNTVSGAQFYNVYEADSPDAQINSWTQVAHLANPITFWTSSTANPQKFYFVTAEK